ncbi:hypothetical protein Acsp04_51430 [Actinomadura sp. NBRC 104425]|uniref:sulfotransferase family protein n=1 Tax=Actinomadura sp. NBRC 104425 TaxID=3032204 RepID=UPI0024A5F0CF|nr:sulfotransferase [Actinomadura sp. NBRC 104425]GLZ14908.1 hypothetical protein Acsp04_51430 [Actinomadura sp. NBRC 104425]
MHGLTWLAAGRQSGGNSAHYLITGYLLDAPPAEVSLEEAFEVAPNLVRLFSWGRMVPLDENRPYVVKADGMPGEEILDPYREATEKVVYLVRDPRTVIGSIVRNSRPEPGERQERAKRLIARLGAVSRSPDERGTWEQHVREWTSPRRARAHFPNLKDVCVLRYEDLLADPAGALRRFVEFLGVLGPVDEDRVRRTVAAWTPESVRDAPISERLPGMAAFEEPRRRRPSAPEPVPSLAEIGTDVEAAYQRRLREDEEFAALVRRFGYET